MVRPKRLRQAAQLDLLPNAFARMLAGKTLMVRRVPILGGDDQGKPRHQLVRHRHNLIAPRHRQRPARQKVVLNVDQYQCLQETASPFVIQNFVILSSLGLSSFVIGLVIPSRYCCIANITILTTNRAASLGM